MPPKKKKKELSDSEKNVVKLQTANDEKYIIIVKPPQRELILNSMEENLADQRIDENYQRRKYCLWIFAFLCFLVGVFIVLFGQALTPLFSSYAPNIAITMISIVFFLPMMYWFVIIFLPCKEERARRRRMYRNKVERVYIDKMQKLHMAGDLDPPESEYTKELGQFIYNPDFPWMYVRDWKLPKTEIKYDEDGIAWVVDIIVEEEKDEVDEYGNPIEPTNDPKKSGKVSTGNANRKMSKKNGP